MSILRHVKSTVESLPESVGRPLAKMPFGARLGPAYGIYKRLIDKAESHDSDAWLAKYFSNLQSLIFDASERCTFYKDLYKKWGVDPSLITSLSDWQKLPIVTKQDFQVISLNDRIIAGRKGMRINTGGTSGQPLEFFLDNRAFAREWAHMHFIWKAHGYNTKHLKLTFRGKHFDSRVPIRYNAVHNEYVVNANADIKQVVDCVLSMPNQSVVRWLHGYPSLVAEFAHEISKRQPSEIARITGRLFGVLLGSEYPAPVYRDVIENVLSSNIVSWYGHSEMAVLAREVARGVYQTLPTYGFAEAVPMADGAAHRLVCTSYYNNVHPFIRYDTGDLIEPVSQEGAVLTFKIADGRIGDFIIDRYGRRHSLTAIIFGRHHKIFNQLRHLQVRQDADGIVTLLVTPIDMSLSQKDIEFGFDLGDLPIIWRYEKLQSPVRSSAGKIRLKIS